MHKQQWGLLRRQQYAEFVSLPADLQAIKHRLGELIDNIPLQRPAKIVHPPHQRANGSCGSDECLGFSVQQKFNDNLGA